MRIGLFRTCSVVALALAILIILPGLTLAQAYTVVNPPITYNAFDVTTNSTCGRPKPTVGYIPAGPATAKYPVHIFLTGTGGAYAEDAALKLIAETAAKGYLSFTVAYDNSGWELLAKYSCTSMHIRGGCIFSGAQSALGKICAHKNADCSKGVIVSGVSQGGILATLARDHDARIRAALAFAIGDYGKTYPIDGLPVAITANWSCLDNGVRKLPSNKLRVVTGASDDLFGATEAGVRAQLARITGLNACTGQSCLTGYGNGSGYYLVKGTDLVKAGTTSPPTAEHCFMKEFNNCGAPAFNWYFECSNKPWAYHDAYDWLMSFGNVEFRPDPPLPTRCTTPPPPPAPFPPY